MAAAQWIADVTVKVPGVRMQTKRRLTGTYGQLTTASIPGILAGVESSGGRVVRILMWPAP